MLEIFLPQPVREVCDAINTAGTAFVVGGFIRDTLLGIETRDIDIEVYHIPYIQDLKSQLQAFGSIIEAGKSFGVLTFSYKNYFFDVALARFENKIGIGHQGFEVSFSGDADFDTIAQRRDFTINAMGYDTKNGVFEDPFGGLTDLNQHRLAMVNPQRFTEDPLRILRAAGFASRYQLTIDEALLQTAQSIVGALDQLSEERIYAEIEKWFTKAKKPSIGIHFLHTIGAKLFAECDTQLDAFDRVKPTFFHRLILLYAKQSDSHFKSALYFIKSPKMLARLCLYHKHLQEALDQEWDDYLIQKRAVEVNLLLLCELLQPLQKKKAETLCKSAKALGVLEAPQSPLVRGKDLINLTIESGPRFSELLAIAYDKQLKEGLKKAALLDYIKSIK